MHFSRMRTTHFGGHVSYMHVPPAPCMPLSTMHAPGTTHAPQHHHVHPHTMPPGTMPHVPLGSMHTL